MEENNKNNKKSKKGLIIGIIAGVVVVALIVVLCIILLGGKKDNGEEIDTPKNNYESDYRLTGTDIEDFDLYFLKKEISDKNIVYSPISIKYTLEMLKDGTGGNSYDQIDAVVGDYKAKRYDNNTNMSFANAMFVKDEFRSSVEKTYIDLLQQRYAAEVISDPFENPDNMNEWVSNKTFGLIKNLVDDVKGKDFILVNALAIDMDWVKEIQSRYEEFDFEAKYEKYSAYVSALGNVGYTPLEFNNNAMKAKSSRLVAVANKYDIVKDLGEEKIKSTIKTEYEKYLNSSEKCGDDNQPVETVIEDYLTELKANYNTFDTSTDFSFYVDDDVKVFAKSLRSYNGTSLEYIGIMPIKTSLDEYVKNTNSKKLSDLISKVKEAKLESFKDGVITEVSGLIPLFKFEYELGLKEDLQSLGIKDVFDKDSADLSKLTSQKEYISDTSHKALIEFSNYGIKAAAATQMGGLGGINCGFNYEFDVPVEKIDITFDKPFLFIIRDKNTKEVWFVGSVVEPTKYESSNSDTLY